MNPNQRHNLRVKAMTIIALVVAVISIMAIDSDTWIPLIPLTLSFAYLFLFYMANKD